MTIFRDISGFSDSNGEYALLPFRFMRLGGSQSDVLLTNDVGEHRFLDATTFRLFLEKVLAPSNPEFLDLESGHFLFRKDRKAPVEPLAIKYRTKKSYLFDGPTLHIFVVTLRCDHSCRYCQVSRRSESDAGFDMSLDHARAAVRIALRSPSKSITVEFQGGEPLTAFPLMRSIVNEFESRNASVGKDISYVVASTRHHINAEMLEFFKVHRFQLSTSLDGPPALHNKNRPLPTRDSHQRTLSGIARARDVLGRNQVAALTTLTKDSLTESKAIIDTYIEHDFHSIFLRPLSPYGFATRGAKFSEYGVDEFLSFYRDSIDYLIQVNLSGYRLDEAYTSLLLRSILTPFGHNYVDLRSPSGAGLGVLVYNYDGGVFASDEARMLLEMGDSLFKLGTVHDHYEELMSSPAMTLLLSAAVAESIPGCSDCAFLPYCGSDPVDSFARQGDVIGHRPSSPFCKKQMGIFEYLFEKLRENDPQVMSVFTSWATGRDRFALGAH